MMNAAIRQALAKDLVIDITTTGRRSGALRRLEIWFHEIEGRWYITGSPGKRDWHANLLATPQFTFHLKDYAKPAGGPGGPRHANELEEKVANGEGARQRTVRLIGGTPPHPDCHIW